MKYEIKTFKDTQVTAKVDSQENLLVKLRGSTYSDLFAAASIKEAWDNMNDVNQFRTSRLELYCLIGQRSDRRFGNGESFDLKVIANFINSMGYNRVGILHPHSSVSLALIQGAETLSHFEFVKKTFNQLDRPLLISPDAGAYKTTHEIAEKLNADLVPSNKVRVDGKPSITIQGNVAGRNCLIVDDIADGGRTFKYLAEALKAQGAAKVFLYVTHGQFNYGFEELKESIDHVYCTNSYRDIEDDYVTQFKVFEDVV